MIEILSSVILGLAFMCALLLAAFLGIGLSELHRGIKEMKDFESSRKPHLDRDERASVGADKSGCGEK